MGYATLIDDNLTALETLAALGDRRELTEPERHALLRWSGWGPMAIPLDTRVVTGRQPEYRRRIRDAIGQDAMREALMATPNAFYTPRHVVDAVWDLAVALGFGGGRVLEPGCGHGNFIAGTPSFLQPIVEWTGVEQDPTTARIAALLHPAAEIIAKPLQRTSLLLGSFDLVVGNVPFGNEKPYDPLAPKNPELSIHNYFLWRASQVVRPGGLIILVTSRYTMDSKGDVERTIVSDGLDLLGAIRLPTRGLADGGTDAVADILVLRKRQADEEPCGHEWRAARPQLVAGGWVDDDYCHNEYWTSHPEQVIGEMRPAHGHQQGVTMEVRWQGPAEDIPDAIAAAADRIASGAGRAGRLMSQPPAGPGLRREDVVDLAGRKLGSFHLVDGFVMEATKAGLIHAQGGPEMELLIELRDAALALVAAEANHSAPDARLLRSRASWLYQVYVRSFGPINRCSFVEGRAAGPDGERPIRRQRPRVMGTLRRDPDYPLLLALENYDDDTGDAKPSPILLGRFNRPPRRRDHADTPAEAVALCLDEHGYLSRPTLARLLGIPEDDVLRELGSLAYEDPATGELVTDSEYLSSNVRVKLEHAIEAAEREPDRWERNVTALRAIQPRPLGPEEIILALGSPVLLPSDIEDFLFEVVDDYERVEVEHLAATASWVVDAPAFLRKRAGASVQWGTGRIDAYHLVQLGCNGQVPVVMDKLDGKQVKNADETMFAVSRLEALQTRFAAWVWEDPERADRLAAEYNRLFNSEVPRVFTGDFLTFPGLVEGFEPHPWQRAFVARGLATPAALCAHTMGSGKTATMALLARTLKRLGLVKTPAIVVPGHLLEQETRDFGRLFPGARLLMASSEDVGSERRRLCAARCATGDWDAVVMTHAAFTALSMPEDVEAEHLGRVIDAYTEALFEVDSDSRTAKDAAKMIRRLKERLEELRDKPRMAGSITFADLGIDCVFVDEAHLFKNLGVVTRAEGFSMSSSQRAFDLSMKLWWLRQNPERKRFGYLFTGTPVSNSLVELFILLQYLDPDELQRRGIDQFDAFAAIFIKFITGVEVAPDGGGFRMHTRPRGLRNVPEVRLLLSRVADVLTEEDMDLELPEVIEETEVAEPGQPTLDYVRTLVARTIAIRRREVKPKEDNMLKVCTAGRQVALWPPLVNVDATPNGKVDLCIERVVGIWNEHRVIPAGITPPPDPIPEGASSAAPGTRQGTRVPIISRYPPPSVATPTSTRPSTGGGPDNAAVGQMDLLAWAAEMANRPEVRANPALALAEVRKLERAQDEGRRMEERETAPRSSVLQVIFCELGTPKSNGLPSVYGYVRDGLVQRGIARHRIKFVQDAKTPAAKQALFAACGAGEVDVLMGTTEGLGLGVNIQNHLYAIHHLDAPWRPADIQQRRGRMVRTGNRHKVVREIRYVTERTFDAYMWQTLKYKIKFILQLWAGKLDMREIEDIGDGVLSYAEVLALATGNTLLLDLTAAEATLLKLQNLRSGYVRGRWRLEREAKADEEEAGRQEAKARTMAQLAELAGAAESVLALDGEETGGRQEIGRALAKSFLTLLSEAGGQEYAGRYRGLTLQAVATRETGRQGSYWTLALNAMCGQYEGAFNFPLTWLEKGQSWRLVSALDEIVDTAAERALQLMEAAGRARARAADARAQLDKPFEQAEALAAAQAKVDDLQAQAERAAGKRDEAA